MRVLLPLICLVLMMACSSTPEEAPQTILSDSTPPAEVDAPVVVINPDSAEYLIEETDVTDNIIKEGRFGPVMVGMPVEELANLFGEGAIVHSTRMEEGDSIDLIEVIDEESKKVLFELTPECAPDCRVDQMVLRDSHFVTLENLGVGSTLAELKGSYEVSLVVLGFDYSAVIVYVHEFDHTGFVFPAPADMDATEQAVDLNLLPDTLRMNGVYSYYPIPD